MIEFILQAAAAGGITGAVVVLFLREWLSERLKQSISDEYSRKLEEYKRDVELRFNDQMRLRKLYEDLSFSLEDIFGRMPERNSTEMAVTLHKVFALLALYAPDDVYRQVKGVFYGKGEKIVYARDFRPAVYHALRKSLFGATTCLEPADLVDNIETTPLVVDKPVG